MPNTDRLFLCMKISQSEWIKSLREGNAWFGLINNYILQAERSGNNEQGDRYEGVFARCPKDSPLVTFNSFRFGNDLEVIDDGDCVLLRRKSSRNACAFCMYGVRYSDLTQFGDVDSTGSKPSVSFRYDIEQKMFDNFLQDGTDPASVTGFYCSAGHLIDALEKSLIAGGYRWKRDCVQYDIESESTFYIEPTSSYPELWHKRKDLSYQHEVRIVIFNNPSPQNGICIKYPPLTTHSGNIGQGQLYIEGTAILSPCND